MMPAASRDNLLGKQKADSLPDPSDGVRTFSAFGVGKTTCTSQPKMELIDDLPAPYDGQPVIANLEESFEELPFRDSFHSMTPLDRQHPTGPNGLAHQAYIRQLAQFEKAVGKSPFGFKVIVLDQRGEAKGWQDRLREILNHWTR